jgi:glycosyltransferase involved in cell wall biosynthesis
MPVTSCRTISAMPRVTVLSSTYRDALYIGRAIESVLAQTYADFEYLILNDAAIDESRAIAASYADPRIRIVDNEVNLGLTKTLNRGLALANGELIARFDSNDICFPERLAKQVAFLDSHPDVAAVGVQAHVIDLNGRRIRRAEYQRPTTDLGIDWYCLFDTPLIHPGSMYRRSVVYDELGGYDEEYRVGQDAELWLRVRRGHKLANLGEALLALRYDRQSISSDVTNPLRADHRQRYLDRGREIMQWFLNRDDMSDEWRSMWFDVFHPDVRMSASRARASVDALDWCFERFCELHPEARTNPEIASQRVYVMQRAVAKAAQDSGWAACSLLRRIASIDPASAAAALPRLVLGWIAGDLPNRLWRSWRYGSPPRDPSRWRAK